MRPMTTPGQERTSSVHLAMSALPRKPDIEQTCRHVRLVPKADSCSAAKNTLIRSAGRRGRTAPLEFEAECLRHELTGCSTGISAGLVPRASWLAPPMALAGQYVRI